LKKHLPPLQINKKEDGILEANSLPTPGKTATPINRRVKGAPGPLVSNQPSNEAKGKNLLRPIANGSTQLALPGTKQKSVSSQ